MPFTSSIVVSVEECRKVLEEERVVVRKVVKPDVIPNRMLLSSRPLVPSPVAAMSVRHCHQSMEVAIELLSHLQRSLVSWFLHRSSRHADIESGPALPFTS
jgi:hypothetical protein